MESDLLLTITIPEYLTRVCVSQRRQKKYIKRGGKMSDTMVKNVKKGVLYFNKQGFLTNHETGERVIANPIAAGTPKWEQLAGNKFSYGNYPPHLRATLVEALKKDYRDKLPFLTPFSADAYPLRVEWDLHTIVGKSNFDLSNLWFYYKYFEDTLVNLNILPDDSIRFVSHPPAPRLIPIEKWEDRAFVFRFYPDNRACVRNHPLWQAK